MKRFLACLILTIAPLSAEASTELARQWGVEATRLATETTDLIMAVDMGETAEISDTYALDIYRFGRTSADLAHWIDQSDGPHDLGCIFRGMAAESEAQLTDLETSLATVENRDTLRRLAVMFSDAEIISVAAQHRAPARAVGMTTSPSHCAGDSSLALEALR